MSEVSVLTATDDMETQLDRVEDKLDELLEFFDQLKALMGAHPLLKNMGF